MSKAVKTQPFEALFRPHLEYACTLWDSYTQVNVRRLDSVQRRAARYVCSLTVGITPAVCQPCYMR